MPVLDGYSATEQIRTYIHSKNLVQPIILAITGHTEQSYIEKAHKSGMNAVSNKPIDLDLLKVVL